MLEGENFDRDSKSCSVARVLSLPHRRSCSDPVTPRSLQPASPHFMLYLLLRHHFLLQKCVVYFQVAKLLQLHLQPPLPLLPQIL